MRCPLRQNDIKLCKESQLGLGRKDHVVVVAGLLVPAALGRTQWSSHKLYISLFRVERLMKNHETEFRQAGALEGKYANYFKVGHNAFEFILDFGQLYLETQEENCTPESSLARTMRWNCSRFSGIRSRNTSGHSERPRNMSS
jgi:hypothetical protein